MPRIRILASTALALALALGPGLATAAGNKPASGQSAGSASGEAKSARQVSTKDYIEKAAAGDLFEVETGKLAMQKAASSDVKRFGKMMTEDHMRSTDMIRNAAPKTNKDKETVAKMTGHQQGVTRQLMSAEGREFDRLYVQAQIDAHRQALELHRSYAASGEDAELKKVAAEIVPVIERHLAELRKISNTVTGSR